MHAERIGDEKRPPLGQYVDSEIGKTERTRTYLIYRRVLRLTHNK